MCGDRSGESRVWDSEGVYGGRFLGVDLRKAARVRETEGV